NNNLFMLNGRIGRDKFVGAPTFRDKSLIDYTLATAECFSLISDFEVIEMDALFSDGHSLLSWSLKIPSQCLQNDQNIINFPSKCFKWSNDSKQSFIENINVENVLRICERLDSVEPSTENLNNILHEIAGIFQNSATSSLKQTNYRIKRRSFDKPWFGPACKTARKKYHRAKHLYDVNKSNNFKKNLLTQSKHFKKTMNKYIKRHKIDKSVRLRNMQSKNPKEYWRYLNSINRKISNTKQPTITEFYEYFKNVNENRFDTDDISNVDLTDANEILNGYITETEINTCIKNLKNGKSPGEDQVLNEYIKSTKHIFLPLYEKLFNKVFDSGNLPDMWLEGIIRPIYKNKGDSKCPQNYRPITILSCLGKLFTAILNTRLTKFTDIEKLIPENQAGFRKDYCTSDHIFVLSSLIEILKSKKQKLYCAFIDFAQAFDSVWRSGLWRKLLFNSVKGKFFKIVYNMYDNIKSCVRNNNETSVFFPCQCGVRQGENLSPLLFAIYLNDLESFLLSSGSEGLMFEFNNEGIQCYLKLLILLYADDTVIFSNDINDFQKCLDAFFDYCNMWKLTINYDKTKVIVFNSRKTCNMEFKIGENIIEIIDRYKYLGVMLFKSGSFLNAKKHIVEQARKAMYLLFMRINNLDLPLDLQLKLFDNTVVPILTYASEIWGFENVEIIERVHTEFLRKITYSKKSTPKYILYAELGRHPLELQIKQKMINYWTRLVTGKTSKLSYKLYLYMFNSSYQFKWLNCIQTILNHCGMNYLWRQQFYFLPKNTPNLVKSRLKDQYFQNWNSQLQLSSKGINYSLFKTDIEFENYIHVLYGKLFYNMFKFRSSNHKLPIEKGRWENIDHADRKCNLCQKNDIGDEFHYLLVCPFFKRERSQAVDYYFYRNPNIIKFKELLNIKSEAKLSRLSTFMGIIMNVFK
ncbi:MAG: reverse transcriptase family protein, partial [Candidatus Thiodiazotropha sp.]